MGAVIVTEVGLRETVRPAGAPDVARLMVPLNPAILVNVMADKPTGELAFTVSEVGVAIMVKSGPICTVMKTEWTSGPLVPVTFTT